jgi:vacuolar-type H+-ATPase subunit E/Vma4
MLLFPRLAFLKGRQCLLFRSGSIEDCKPNWRMCVDHKNEIVTVALRSKPPVLRSESADEYNSLYKKLVVEIRPQGPIEAVYVEEITALIWDIQRLRNCKVSVIHQMSRRALESLLTELLTIHQKIKAQALAKKWFEDAAAREEVSEILKRFDLDESAIEAEAIRLASDQLEWLDKALVLATSRLDKSLRFIKSYRVGFADDLRRQSDRLLLANVPPRRSVAPHG